MSTWKYMRLAFPTLHFLYSQLSAIVYRNGSQKREAFYQNLFQEAPSISEDQRKDPRLLAPMLQRVCDFNKKKKKKKVALYQKFYKGTIEDIGTGLVIKEESPWETSMPT